MILLFLFDRYILIRLYYQAISKWFKLKGGQFENKESIYMLDTTVDGSPCMMKQIGKIRLNFLNRQFQNPKSPRWIFPTFVAKSPNFSELENIDKTGKNEGEANCSNMGDKTNKDSWQKLVWSSNWGKMCGKIRNSK